MHLAKETSVEDVNSMNFFTNLTEPLSTIGIVKESGLSLMEDGFREPMLSLEGCA